MLEYLFFSPTLASTLGSADITQLVRWPHGLRFLLCHHSLRLLFAFLTNTLWKHSPTESSSPSTLFFLLKSPKTAGIPGHTFGSSCHEVTTWNSSTLWSALVLNGLNPLDLCPAEYFNSSTGVFKKNTMIKLNIYHQSILKMLNISHFYIL